MTCSECQHWRPLVKQGLEGYGTCAVRPGLESRRVAHMTADSNVCRINRFVPIKEEQ